MLCWSTHNERSIKAGLILQAGRVCFSTTMTSDPSHRVADWPTTVLLLTLLLWQRIPAAESGCVSEVCFCFPGGDVECAGIYLRRVPRFTRSNTYQLQHHYSPTSIPFWILRANSHASFLTFSFPCFFSVPPISATGLGSVLSSASAVVHILGPNERKPGS